jgi:hypothetical protein
MTMKLGKLIVERKSDKERAAELRSGAATIRKGGLGRLGKHEADRAERKAAKLDPKGKR